MKHSNVSGLPHVGHSGSSDSQRDGFSTGTVFRHHQFTRSKPRGARWAIDTDNTVRKPHLWQRMPSFFAFAAILCFLFSFTLSAMSYVPPRPILPDVIAGILFFFALVFAALAFWGFLSRGRKR